MARPSGRIASYLLLDKDGITDDIQLFNEKQREYLSYITTSTNALLAIINNILDLATIDAGAMTLNLGNVDIRRTMEAAAEGVQDRLEQGDIALSIRSAPDIGTFVADERRLRQTLFNLLANAISFSPPGGMVTLAAQRLQNAVVFMVTDQAPGIPPDVRDRVFDWFETHSLGSRHRGTGLGLSLVRSFVELHGGTVTIDMPGSEEVAAELLRRDVIVDYRPGAGIRMSPHFYNTQDEIDRAMATVDAIAADQ